jgi:hypothetical protein
MGDRTEEERERQRLEGLKDEFKLDEAIEQKALRMRKNISLGEIKTTVDVAMVETLREIRKRKGL